LEGVQKEKKEEPEEVHCREGGSLWKEPKGGSITQLNTGFGKKRVLEWGGGEAVTYNVRSKGKKHGNLNRGAPLYGEKREKVSF